MAICSFCYRFCLRFSYFGWNFSAIVGVGVATATAAALSKCVWLLLLLLLREKEEIGGIVT